MCDTADNMTAKDAKSEAILEICITDTERRCSGSAVPLQDIYIAYQVETSVQGEKESPCHFVVWRRYSDFEYLKMYFQETYPYVIVPPLPERRVMYGWQQLPTDKLDPDFVERRRAGLEKYLHRVVKHPVLSSDELFFVFLRKEAGWRDTVSTAGLLQKADTVLKSLNASLRLKNPDKTFEEIKSYSDELYSSISSILRIRAKLVDRVYGVHKVHQNYGRVFSEWSRLEKQMGDELQKAGQFMDKFANCVDPLLEEEEIVADQLKEYLFYAESLKSVCRKQEMLQYELEKKEALSVTKDSQRTQMVQSNSGGNIVSRLLSPRSTEQQHDQKVAALHQEVQNLSTQIHLLSQEKQEFSEKALEEVQRFQQQKDKDLKEALILYVIMQIKMCNESISTWSNIHECFEKM